MTVARWTPNCRASVSIVETGLVPGDEVVDLGVGEASLDRV